MYHRIAVSLYRLPLALGFCFTLAAATGVMAEDIPAPELPAPVGEVDLVRAGSLPETSLLDVGIVIFDPGIPEDESTHSKLGIFPEIRKSEAQIVTVILRQVLVNSGFKRLDFFGPAPGSFRATCTTIFYKSDNCLGI